MLFSTGRTARRLLAAVLATTFCTGPGAAMTLCLYEDYRGARTEAGAGSILGTGFQLDQEKARVRRIYGEAATEWYPVSLKESVAFVSAAHETEEFGITPLVRWSFRVHGDGDCEARVDASSFEMITAKGRVSR